LREPAAGLTLEAYGIATPRQILTTTVEAARTAANAIGYPVALKIDSPDIRHKTESGGVLLDVANDADLRAAYERLLANVRNNAPRARVNGVLVQEMVPQGVEMILGMSRDRTFGPLVAVGLGGVLVEVLKDVQFLLPPITEREARQALQRLKGYPMLHGVRGRPPADIDALVDTLLRFSSLCVDVGTRVDEIDINPLIVLDAGHGVRAVDWLIVPARNAEDPG
jgi:acetyltransferase